jgi:glycosyltransferase involved in cell wall biosynthesis
MSSAGASPQMDTSARDRQMSISVGIPTYNQGQFLVEALDALLSQTVAPDEIVVSDNSSTDGTKDILRRYEGRVRLIRPPEFLPMVAHFNFLVENMGGDWFSVLGGDDVAEPWFVEHLSQAARKERDGVMVRGGWRLVSLSGRPVGHHRLWSTATVTRAPQSFLEELGGPKPWLSAVLFRRSAWSEVGGFPTSLRHSFDWGLYLRLSAIGSFVTTHRTVSRFRTGYPKSKDISRFVDKAHDERVIALEIAPAVAKILGLSAEPAMARAAQYRLKAMLFEADIATDAGVRARVATELRPLATALDQERLLDDFTAGQVVATPVRFRKLVSGVQVINAQSRTVVDRLIRLGGERQAVDARGHRGDPLMAKAAEGSPAALDLPKSTPERSRATLPASVLPPRILISNGFGRFHLAYLAAALRQRGWDVELLTGAYPSGPAAAILRDLPIHGSYWFGRLEDRQVVIEPDRVHADFASELITRTGGVLGSKGAMRLGAALEEAGFRFAGLRAARKVRGACQLDAYHFRSGFGLESVDAARRRGIPAICDHSIVHPATLEPLVQNGGRLPAGWTPIEPRGIWRPVLRDIETADWVVVNSDFVRQTFEWVGFDTTRVKVIYLGVEPEFVRSIEERVTESGEGPLRLLFVGQIGQRKGADILFRALSTLRGVDWTLNLVGPITPAIAADWSKFLGDPRVACLGAVRRQEVAALMSRAEVFIFPSLAEGSARVVAEAMAAGCYVITTPNSGSVVRDGIHGRLVPPGDHDALAATLMEAADRREMLRPIGRMNAELIRREYLVEHYADRVISFYDHVLQPN